MRTTLSAIRTNPDLAACEPNTVLGCIIQAAELGLEFHKTLGQAYLIPRWNNKKRIKECTLLVGYRGYITLARRSGEVKNLYARVVRQGDEFDYMSGDHEQIYHKPIIDNENEVICAYAIAHLMNGEILRKIVGLKKLNKIAQDTDNPVWKTHFEEMCCKTAIRAISKGLPLSPEFADAIECEDKEAIEAQVLQKTALAPAKPQPLDDFQLTAQDEKDLALLEYVEVCNALIERGIRLEIGDEWKNMAPRDWPLEVIILTTQSGREMLSK